MSERRERYLAAMGIVAWRLRAPAGGTRAPAASVSGEAAARPSEADVGLPEGTTSLADAAARPAAAAALRADRPARPPAAAALGADAAARGADAATLPADAASPAARAGDEGAGDGARTGAWLALAAEASACTRCALHRGRTQTVFGVGRRDAELMVIGEAPGAEEDRQGEPFVGRAGQLLNAMLRAIGFARQDVYIANVLKCRPPGNRDPRREEAAACTSYLERQIALVRPRVVLAVGRVAAQWLLQSDVPIGRLRGQVFRFGEPAVALVVTYHPAYLLRTPLAKAKAWEDLLAVRRLLRPVQ